MGVVFKARDAKLERHVAIKFLYQNSDRGQGIKGEANNNQAKPLTDQILQEARRLAQVNHPNVVSVYELCETDNRSAIVMEYLSGTPLSDIQKEQLLSQNQKLSYLIQITQGMIAIHEAGLRHGDLKAENVWITDEKTVKLLDFGLSAEIDNQQSNRDTTNYSSASLTTLSPEFCQGEPLTQQTDIFNFGCLACRLLTDKLPFEIGSVEACQDALRNGKIAKVSDLSPVLSGALAQVLDHCLMLIPKERTVSFSQVLKQLRDIEQAFKQQQLDNNATVPLEPLTPITKPSEPEQSAASVDQTTASPTKRNKLLAVVASIALFIALSVLVWHKSTQPPPEKSVLILSAKMISETELPPEQTRMIKAALDNALRDSVINTQSLHLISRSELDPVANDLNSSLKATGASNALQPLVDCQGSSCQISIERINGSSALIEKQIRWHSPALDVYEISTLAQSYFQQLFPDYPMADGYLVTVSKEAYEEFARLYAQLQFGTGNTSEQLDLLRDLLKTSPYLLSGYRLYRDGAIKLFYDTGDDKFLVNLDTVLSDAPKQYKASPSFIRDMFLLRLAQQDLAKAQAIINSAQINGLDNVTLSELKGIFYLQNGKAKEAKKQFERSLNSRFSAVTLYNLALSHWELGEIERAIVRLNELLNILPDYYYAEQLLASLYLYTGQLSEALLLFEQFAAGSPETADLNNLGLTYLLQGELEKALYYSRKAFENSSQNSALLLNLADIELLSNKSKSAKSRYLTLINKLDKQVDVDSLLIKAQAYTHLGDYLMATKLLNTAIKLAPENSEVTFIASLIYTVTSQYPLAIVKVEEALKSGYGEIWYHLPWFIPLCEYDEYRALLTSNNSPCD